MEQTVKNIHFIENLRKAAAAEGSRTAIVYNNGKSSMSYAELDHLSSAIADKIHHSEILPGTPVAVMMQRDALSIAAEIGVLKAGAAFVPLMPSYPKERIEYIMKDCNAGLMIDADYYSDLSEYNSAFEPALPCEDMVMVIYTSGSTGRPKGVVYDLAAYNATVQRLSVNYGKIDSVILGAFAPMAFVAHVAEYAAVFNCGGTTHIIPDELRTDPIRLEQYYRDNRITAAGIPQKIFAIFQKKLPDLQIVILSGEKICNVDPKDDKVIVSYGQTEAISIMEYPIDSLRKEAFVGTAVPGTEVFLLDDQGNDVGLLHEGEICAKGIYPRRYLNLPAETKKTFEETDDGEVLVHTGDIGIRHENGLIEYINRRDFMIKINGNRVDPSEIESAVKQFPGVTDAIVKGFDGKNGRIHLCCYYVSGETTAPQTFRKFLGKTLPFYMIPKSFVRLDCLPRTATGKPDRSALPEPELQTEEEYVAPVSEDEKKLCDIVENLLGVGKAGMADNFFELGADSLQVAQLVSTLAQEGMGIIEATQVYEHPVLSDLMRCIAESALVGNGDYTVLSKGKAGSPPLIFYHSANTGADSYRTLAQSLPQDIPFMSFENHNLNYPDVPLMSVRAMVKYYQLVGGSYLEKYCRKGAGAKIFGGWSFGGNLAFEAARNAEEAGEAVAGVILLDPLLIEKEKRSAAMEIAADPNLKKYFEEEAVFADVKKGYDVNRILENNRLVARILSEYEPSGKLACKVLFIKAANLRDTDQAKALCYEYPANGFEKYCDNISIATVGCNHDEIVRNPEALEIIRKFVSERAQYGE